MSAAPAPSPPAGRRISCCIIAKGRIGHLRRVLDGLAVQSRAADEVVVAAMGDLEVLAEASAHPVVSTALPVGCGDDDPLPLARARNAAASAATGDQLIFLDVDCIPDEHLVADYERQRRAGLLMGGVRYLPPGVPEHGSPTSSAQLRAAGRLHPARPAPSEAQPTAAYELFWSLNFSVSRGTWCELGGFDESYVGYGAEDTDLAFRARSLDVPAWFVAGAEAFHQHHESHDPPYGHLRSIVANARRFHDRWGTWPMEGWLHAFVADGLVRWSDDELELTG